MSAHSKNDVVNVNRVRRIERIDYYILQARKESARSSFVVNPLTGAAYPEAAAWKRLLTGLTTIPCD